MSIQTLDLRNRESVYQSLESGTYDVLIIGAGITGCGIARDAALRGMKVALVDARDIASGLRAAHARI